MKQSASLLALAAFIAAVYFMETPSERCQPCSAAPVAAPVAAPIAAAGAYK